MERRDRSLKALDELIYIDSLDADLRAEALVKWNKEYLQDGNTIDSFDLEIEDLKRLAELFFKSIDFLKNHKENTRKELIRLQKMKRFLNH